MKKNGRGYYRLIIMTIVLIGGLLFILGGWALAKEEKFPARPINIIIPWAPGSGGTINAQALQPHIEKATGEGVIITNKPGAGSTIGLNYVANSPPDGYNVVLIGASSITAQYVLKSGVSMDRFAPFIRVYSYPFGVMVKEDSPWRTFKQFVDYAKANPGKVRMGNSGFGATVHIGTLGLQVVTGCKFAHVPFKGVGPTLSALLGGHVDGALGGFTSVLTYVLSKDFRMLAVTSPSRSPLLPDVPTLKECGYDREMTDWFGYAVPKGTPQDRIKILHDAFKAGVDSKEFIDFYAKQGVTLDCIGLEDMVAFMKQQDKLWKGIIDYVGLKPTD